MVNFLNKKLLPKILAFVNTKAVQAIKDGMVYSMPLLIIGSIFLIISNFPVKAVVDVLETNGIKAILDQAYGATFNISAIIAVLGISYSYIKAEKHEPLSGAVIALGVFVLFSPSTVLLENGESVGNVISKTWTAGQGMIGAIIIGLFVGFLYSWFLNKDIRIKMPAGVPVGVTNAFSSLFPAMVIISVATVIAGFFVLVLDTTVMEGIYTMIQLPLQGMTDSPAGAIIMCFMVPFLWIFGVHGSTIVGGIMTGILQANSLANQEILDSGVALTVENGGKIVTQQFLDQFITVSGAGITLGLVLYMLILAKSKQLKTLGKLELIPAIFNINEPILFGIPIVMNPILAIPFILTPVVACIIQYFALYTGLCPLYGAAQVPWTCPPIISGLLVGGWRSALLQIVIFVIAFLLYLPFIRKIDLQNLKTEQEAETAANDEDDDW